MDIMDQIPPVTNHVDRDALSPAVREWLRGSSPMLKAQLGAAGMLATAFAREHLGSPTVAAGGIQSAPFAND
jgi:hypothetical protein